MRERDTVWIEIAEKKRPAVAIEVQPDLVRVAYGTSQERSNIDTALVHPETRQGRSFPLREPTYFYGDNTEWEEPSKLGRGNGQCSTDLFFQIRQLVERYDAMAIERDE